jgi:hypothetical protein
MEGSKHARKNIVVFQREVRVGATIQFLLDRHGFAWNVKVRDVSIVAYC